MALTTLIPLREWDVLMSAEALLNAVKLEHTTVAEGLFGASDTVFTPTNYQVPPIYKV